MRKLLLFIALLCVMPAWAQTNRIDGNISAAATTCATVTACVVLPIGNAAGVGIQLGNTFTGTIVFEATSDGSNWVAILGTPPGTATAVTSATAPGAWQFNTAGMIAVRARASALSAGGPSVAIQSTSSGPGRASGGSAGGNTVNCGTGANTYLAYFTDAFTVCGDAGFVYNETPTAPTVFYVESDQAANGKWWANGYSAGVATRSLCSDTGTGCAAFETTTRSGLTVSSMVFSSTAFTFSGAATWATLNSAGYTSTLNVMAGGFGAGTGAPSGNDIIETFASVNAAYTWELRNTNSGTSTLTSLDISNANNANLQLRTFGTGFTTSGPFIQDGSSITTSATISGGLAIGTVANATLGFWTQNALRFSVTGAGVLTFDATMVTPASTGFRFLCISTAGVITSGTDCVGT